MMLEASYLNPFLTCSSCQKSLHRLMYAEQWCFLPHCILTFQPYRHLQDSCPELLSVTSLCHDAAILSNTACDCVTSLHAVLWAGRDCVLWYLGYRHTPKHLCMTLVRDHRIAIRCWYIMVLRSCCLLKLLKVHCPDAES